MFATALEWCSLIPNPGIKTALLSKDVAPGHAASTTKFSKSETAVSCPDSDTTSS